MRCRLDRGRASGQVKKFQDFWQDIVKITQRVITALQQAHLARCVPGQHFAPIQHLIPLGDHGQA